MIGGIDARKKAIAVGESLLSRTRRLFQLRGLEDYINTQIEVLGSEYSMYDVISICTYIIMSHVMSILIHHIASCNRLSGLNPIQQVVDSCFSIWTPFEDVG